MALIHNWMTVAYTSQGLVYRYFDTHAEALADRADWVPSIEAGNTSKVLVQRAGGITPSSTNGWMRGS